MEALPLELEVTWHPVAEQDVPRVEALLRAARDANGRAPLNEEQRIALHNVSSGNGPDVPPARRPIGIFAASAAPGGTSGIELVGYAQLIERPGGYWLEAAVDPDHHRDRATIFDALVATALPVASELGPGEMHLWLHDAPEGATRRDGDAAAKSAASDEDLGRVAEGRGFHLERTLLEMRCPLPLPPQPEPRSEPQREHLPLRTFRPGRDDRAWLEVNNRSFADHPEQGRWELSTLRDRMAQAWFDPEGFLLLEEGGRISASCWTKIEHEPGIGPVGEIYVISVDPSQQGRGLGRLLTVAGLDWLAGQGAVQGMLYVDAENQAAVSLYRSLGFSTVHVDRAYLAKI